MVYILKGGFELWGKKFAEEDGMVFCHFFFFVFSIV
jgi:hypothetical protein